MTSYTTLVNVDAEAAEKLCHFISLEIPEQEQGQQFFSECQDLIDNRQTKELIFKILGQQTLMLTLENTLDAEGCFESLFSLIYVLEVSNEDRQSIIRSIVKSLTADTTTKPRLTLKVMMALFNLTFSGASKFEVLTAIFPYARATNQTDQIVHWHSKYQEWIKAWKLNVDQQRALLKELFLVQQQTNASAESLKTMIMYFQTYKETKWYPKVVEELIQSSLLAAIKSPISAFNDRVSLLESLYTDAFTEPLSSLVTLLRIICDGSLSDFRNFCKTNNSIFQEFDISRETLDHMMHLLSLCSLASTSQNKVISFQTVKDTLGCQDDYEVENWVIEAISENLIQASIDQMKSTISVTQFTRRSFGMNDWKALQQQLRVLRKNVATCVENIEKTKGPVV